MDVAWLSGMGVRSASCHVMLGCMSALPKHEMTADEFLAWDLKQPKSEGGKLELADGLVITQQSERIIHVEVKAALASALREAILRAKLPCFALHDGATVRVAPKKVYKPDGLVYCGPRLPPETVEIPDPAIIFEVLSEDSLARDHGDKVEAYFTLPSLQHYLIVDPERRAVVHHRRGPEDDLLTRIRKTGSLRFEPPGIEIDLGEIFERE